MAGKGLRLVVQRIDCWRSDVERMPTESRPPSPMATRIEYCTRAKSETEQVEGLLGRALYSL